MSGRARAQRLAAGFFRYSINRAPALRFAAVRGRALVLLYHRVLRDGAPPSPIVPSLPVSVFRRQLEALLQLGDIVPVAELLGPRLASERPRFAITFDDDHAGYLSTVVPELDAFGISATFFLSGRALHDLPPYWWSFLEESIRSRGFDATRRALGIEARSVRELAAFFESSSAASQLLQECPYSDDTCMRATDIRALARAGMTIGFHTLHHPVLARLSDDLVDDALTTGRDELAGAAGTRINLLAYPHVQLPRP